VSKQYQAQCWRIQTAVEEMNPDCTVDFSDMWKSRGLVSFKIVDKTGSVLGYTVCSEDALALKSHLELKLFIRNLCDRAI